MEPTLYEIESSKTGTRVSATVSSLGAALCGLSIGKHEVIEQAPFKPTNNFFYGVVMAPWSNRVKDGLWVDPRGNERLLPINEPANNSALHGLVHDQEVTLVEKTDDSVTVKIVIEPTAGYPYQIDLEVKYEIDDKGMKVSHRAKNLSDDDAPFGIAYHPYPKFSPANSKDLKIVSGARSRYVQDNQHIPLSKEPTFGTSFDFSSGITVDDHSFDEQLTDIPLDNSGHRITKLLAPGGGGIEIWQDASFEHLLIYTNHSYPLSDGETTVIAIEPSSSAANAFNSGEDLIWHGRAHV